MSQKNQGLVIRWPKHGFQLIGIDNLTNALDYRMKHHLSENDLCTIDSGLVAKVAMCCIKSMTIP